MPQPTLTIEPAGTAFELVVRRDGKVFRYPAHKLIGAEVMASQEKRRLGLTPPHLTLEDLRRQRAVSE